MDTVIADELALRLDRSMSTITRPALIRRFYQLIADRAGVDLERSSYLILKHLVYEGPARITQLAATFGVEPSTISRHTASLEEEGLLAKQPDPDDGRAALAEATRRGVKMVRRLEEERRNFYDSLLAEWDRTDAERFVDLIERFHRAIHGAVTTS
ncbi:MAG TPA: MarR family transcriptional regulator [Acidimicrobiia bacterium]|nr:MarR family transcriptional regulator [Acidimicrobiia bacterium]